GDDVANAGGAEPLGGGGRGFEVVDVEVEVETVLAALGLRYDLERKLRTARHDGLERDPVAIAALDAGAEDGRPELDERFGVVAVDRDHVEPRDRLTLIAHARRRYPVGPPLVLASERRAERGQVTPKRWGGTVLASESRGERGQLTPKRVW